MRRNAPYAGVQMLSSCLGSPAAKVRRVAIGPPTTAYDRLGRSYDRHRRADPRIAARVLAALQGSCSVVDVGAGTGSYEPADRMVVAVEIVRIPHDCTDGFFGAYWRRPDAYLERGVRGSISALARLGETAVRPAIGRLAADLRSGAWERRYGHLLELDEIDLGYRLVVSPPS